MSAQVEEQVRLGVDAIRTARSQPGAFDYQVIVGLTNQVKAAAPGSTMKERRAFLIAVGTRLQEEAGPSQEVKFKGLAGTHRRWEDPDGQSIYDFGTLLILMAKPR